MESYSAFQQVEVPKEFFSVYCDQSMVDKINPVGLRSINTFKHTEKHLFKAYMALKTGGTDKVSSESEKSLKESVGEKNYNAISEYFDGKDILTCMRWFVRGLSLGDAIRKVQVDLEVSENAMHKRGR